MAQNNSSAGPNLSQSRIFQPLTLGKEIQLSSRLIMAPLTRYRATDSHVPNPLMATYYAQRACYPGTLLITEATFITARAGGFANAPGIWSPEQIDGWRLVTNAVHANKSYIFLQVFALGRTGNPDILQKSPGGPYSVVSSSPTPLVKGSSGKANSPDPPPLTPAEIDEYVEDYATAARNAIAAGFDGVEIHGANGYLIDQFTQDTCNKRTDFYGGSIENRARFGLEVTQAIVDAVGSHRVGIRLSPFSTFQGMKMESSKIIPQFTYLIQGLKKMNLAYIHAVESRISGAADVEATEQIDFIFPILQDHTPVFIAGGFTPASAHRAVDDEYREHEIGIVFGRYFISTPDLVYRVKKGLELSPYNRKTFYVPKSEEGYIDYPYSEEWMREEEEHKGRTRRAENRL